MDVKDECLLNLKISSCLFLRRRPPFRRNVFKDFGHIFCNLFPQRQLDGAVCVGAVACAGGAEEDNL